MGEKEPDYKRLFIKSEAFVEELLMRIIGMERLLIRSGAVSQDDMDVLLHKVRPLMDKFNKHTKFSNNLSEVFKTIDEKERATMQ